MNVLLTDNNPLTCIRHITFHKQCRGKFQLRMKLGVNFLNEACNLSSICFREIHNSDKYTLLCKSQGKSLACTKTRNTESHHTLKQYKWIILHKLNFIEHIFCLQMHQNLVTCCLSFTGLTVASSQKLIFDSG